VFVLQFPVGEFDMVVFDPEAGSCQIFEIKHSEEAVQQQYRHLIDEQKCARPSTATAQSLESSSSIEGQAK
jgi:Holliday junction resolvase-like predicted endonuclease